MDYDVVKNQAEAYAKAQGYELKTFKGIRKGATYINDEGDTIKVSAEDIASFTAYQEVVKSIVETIDNSVQIIEEGTKNLNDTQTEALSTFANGEIGDLSQLTVKEI